MANWTEMYDPSGSGRRVAGFDNARESDLRARRTADAAMRAAGGKTRPDLGAMLDAAFQAGGVPPEQDQGRPAPDPRNDSLGKALMDQVRGVTPFSGDQQTRTVPGLGDFTFKTDATANPFNMLGRAGNRLTGGGVYHSATRPDGQVIQLPSPASLPGVSRVFESELEHRQRLRRAASGNAFLKSLGLR